MKDVFKNKWPGGQYIVALGSLLDISVEEVWSWMSLSFGSMLKVKWLNVVHIWMMPSPSKTINMLSVGVMLSLMVLLAVLIHG